MVYTYILYTYALRGFQVKRLLFLRSISAACLGVAAITGGRLLAQASIHGSPALVSVESSSRHDPSPGAYSAPEEALLPEAPSAVSASATPESSPVETSSFHSSFPDTRQRFDAYLASAFGPGAFVAAGISAAVDQTHSLKVGYPADGYPGPGQHPGHGTVPEWGEGFDGYAKRYASRYGMSLVSTTTRFGLGELLHEDVSYRKCECSGVLSRTSHAVTQSFVAHTASGRAVPSLPAIVAPFVGAEVAVAAWYPSRYGVSDALRTSTNLYVSLPVQNVVNEFLRR